MTEPTTTVPAECVRCGQRLMLLAEGRDVCEWCRLGVVSNHPAPAVRGKAEPPQYPPCSGCGRDKTDQGAFPLVLADGLCLACRAQSIQPWLRDVS